MARGARAARPRAPSSCIVATQARAAGPDPATAQKLQRTELDLASTQQNLRAARQEFAR